MTASAKVYRVLSCLKVFLIAFTVLFLCAGILFLATGIYAMVRFYCFYHIQLLRLELFQCTIK